MANSSVITLKNNTLVHGKKQVGELTMEFGKLRKVAQAAVLKMSYSEVLIPLLKEEKDEFLGISKETEKTKGKSFFGDAEKDKKFFKDSRKVLMGYLVAAPRAIFLLFSVSTRFFM